MHQTTISRLESPDYGKPTLTTRGMVQPQLKKTFRTEDGLDTGKPVFTLTRPAVPYKDGGTILCALHQDGPDRVEYDRLGLKVCSMDHIRSLQDLDMHMRHKHPIAFRILERERVQKEKDEDRAFQRTMMQQAFQGKAETPVRPRSPGRPRKGSVPETKAQEG